MGSNPEMAPSGQEPSNKIERKAYFGDVETILSNIKESAGGYEGWWVIGGIARDTILGKKFEPQRADGSVRDVDVLFSVPKLPLGSRLQKENPTSVKLGTSFHNFVKIDPNNEARLVMGSVSKQVPLEVFPTVMMNMEGIDFPTLPPETLFHLQASQAQWREKDIASIAAVAKHIRHNPNPDYPEALYAPFHEYVKELKGAKGGLSFTLMELGQWYMRSRMNKILPLHHPFVRRPLEVTWDALGRVGRMKKERRASNRDS